jgi:hypothetical protein
MASKNEFPKLDNINLENIFQNFLNTLNKEIKDLRSLEILTVSAENLLMDMEKPDTNEPTNLLKDLEQIKDKHNIQILARTHYELDGDIVQFLPMTKDSSTGNVKNLKENNDIMNIHNQNVEKALSNQQNFIKVMTEFVSQVLLGVAGKNDLKGLGNLMDIFVSDKNKT